MVHALSLLLERSEVRCGRTGCGRSAECTQHDTRCSRGRGTVQAGEARERASSGDPRLFYFARSTITVRIYGHYPVIEGKKTTFYRHPIHKFRLYRTWMGKRNGRRTNLPRVSTTPGCPLTSRGSARQSMPYHQTYTLKSRRNRICNFPSASGLSQGLESHHLSESGATDDDELRLLDPQEVTPGTSVTQTSEQATFKKPKKR